MQKSSRKDCSDNIKMVRKIFDEHGDYIRSVIRFNIKNETEADDLFQELFLSLVTSTRAIPKDVKNIKRYLHEVIFYEITDSFRQMERYQSRIHKYAKGQKSMLEGEPETALMAADETKNMFRIIRNSLSQKEALAVTLRYKDNCDIKEIADKMKLKSRTVSRYITIGLRKIRQLLEVSQEESQPATASAEKAEERSKEIVERLVLNVSVGEFSPDDEVAEGIVELYRALNSYYITSGGSGLVIGDWQSFVPDGVPVGV